MPQGGFMTSFMPNQNIYGNYGYNQNNFEQISQDNEEFTEEDGLEEFDHMHQDDDYVDEEEVYIEDEDAVDEEFDEDVDDEEEIVEDYEESEDESEELDVEEEQEDGDVMYQ